MKKWKPRTVTLVLKQTNQLTRHENASKVELEESSKVNLDPSSELQSPVVDLDLLSGAIELPVDQKRKREMCMSQITRGTKVLMRKIIGGSESESQFQYHEGVVGMMEQSSSLVRFECKFETLDPRFIWYIKDEVLEMVQQYLDHNHNDVENEGNDDDSDNSLSPVEGVVIDKKTIATASPVNTYLAPHLSTVDLSPIICVTRVPSSPLFPNPDFTLCWINSLMHI